MWKNWKSDWVQRKLCLAARHHPSRQDKCSLRSPRERVWYEDGVGETGAVDIWADYSKTILLFQDESAQTWTLHPDAVGRAGDWILGPPWFRERTTEAWVITAWSPHSVQAQSPDNKRSNESMVRVIEAAGLRFTPARGQAEDGSWFEDSFLAHDPDPEWLVELAARYRQDAVFHLTRESWSVVGVLLDGTVTKGWTVLG